MPKRRKKLTRAERERQAFDRMHPKDKLLAGMKGTAKHGGSKGAYQERPGGMLRKGRRR